MVGLFDVHWWITDLDFDPWPHFSASPACCPAPCQVGGALGTASAAACGERGAYGEVQRSVMVVESLEALREKHVRERLQKYSDLAGAMFKTGESSLRSFL